MEVCSNIFQGFWRKNKKMIEVGTILQNRYRIEKHIGQGGMGKVYVASDQRFNSTVAIKETVFEDKNLRKAFEREARLLNSLKHQALPRVSDHFTEGDGQFLVMEYIAGEDLAEMMEHRGEAFSLEDVLNWANQLCDALDYLHSQDIIHRDIKPQNLKLTPSGQIVLLDFGLAKGNPTDSQHQTAAKSIFGYSRSYASLEQIQGTGTEPRSDLYSLGATLYHLFTGIPPVDALTRAMNVLNGQPDPLIAANLINRKVPGGVAEILQKAMALNANERPVSAVSMRLMLEKCDKSIDSSAPVNSIAATTFTADLLNQETKIKTAATNVPTSKASDFRTKLSSENVSSENSYKTKLAADSDAESKITRLRPAAKTTQPPKRSRAAVAAVFGGLFLVGSALCAVYLFQPGVSQTNSNNGPTNTETKSSFVITPPENQTFSNANPANQNTIWATKEANARIPDKPLTPKSIDAGKNTVRETKNQTAATQESTITKSTEAQSENVIINGETIETENMIIDQNGIRMKNANSNRRFPARQMPNVVGKPPFPPANFKVFTPEQIRELERLERMRNTKPRIVVGNTPPPPKPTP